MLPASLLIKQFKKANKKKLSNVSLEKLPAFGDVYWLMNKYFSKKFSKNVQDQSLSHPAIISYATQYKGAVNAIPGTSKKRKINNTHRKVFLLSPNTIKKLHKETYFLIWFKMPVQNSILTDVKLSKYLGTLPTNYLKEFKKKLQE